MFKLFRQINFDLYQQSFHRFTQLYLHIHIDALIFFIDFLHVYSVDFLLLTFSYWSILN